MAKSQIPELLCFSHLRWNSVYQRPHHLMGRFAGLTRVFYVEEPIFDSVVPRLEVTDHDGVRVLTPHLRLASSAEAETDEGSLLDRFWHTEGVSCPVLWYYTPMALPLTHLRPAAAVYDCMDELSAFAFAPPELKDRERSLLRLVDIVFTGGQSLYNAKRRLHPHVYLFPSSVDTPHFARARTLEEPHDQAGIAPPRVGYSGVIDERMDLDLLAHLADTRPDTHFILVGPVVKIEPRTLPRRANLHYLGQRAYADLPAYFGGWQAAMLPFARNEATQYISPTKIPEYLAADLPVVSSAIPDVVTTFGARGIVWIADSLTQFASCLDLALREDPEPRRSKVAAFLKGTSWDRTWNEMRWRLEDVLTWRRAAHQPARLAQPQGAVTRESGGV